MTALSILAWLVALAWLWKAVTAFFGLRRIPNLLDQQYDQTPDGNPSITVIVPARDEEANIAATLQSLLQQDYPNLHILAIDDRSTDATGTLIDTFATLYPNKLTAIHITDLPSGWLGKTHAMALAARHAISIHQPDYLLFTDADVLFQPDAIRRSLAQAVATHADHFVTFPTPIIRTPGEGMLLGYLSVMGLWATRPWLASDAKAKRDSIGIGAFNLLRTSVYQQLGGFDALRMEILEDLLLARRVKIMGLRQCVAIAPGMVTLHWATGAFGIVRVMTKNLFAIVRFRMSLVVLTIVWLVFFCVGPVVGVVLPQTRTASMLTLLSIVVLYVVSSRHSRISPLYAVLFPVGTIFFLVSFLRSALTTFKDGGVTWRGTFYSLVELRKNKTPIN